MTPIELCEPLFHYICLLNRAARKDLAPDQTRVRADLLKLFDAMRAKAGADISLHEHFSPDGAGKLELALLFFVDGIIRESKLPFARTWQGMAEERSFMAGDSRFWEMLKETHDSPAPTAKDRLPVYYACIGLGFTGELDGQPELLRQEMARIYEKIRDQIDLGHETNLTPETYEYTNTSDLIEAPGAKLGGILIAVVGLLLVLFVANFYMYRQASSSLNESLNTMIHRAGSADGADSAPTPPDGDGDAEEDPR